MGVVRPIPVYLNLHPPAWHYTKILDFARKKRLVGEPGSNITTLGYFIKDQKETERVWRLGCYCNAYCLPTAQIMWSNASVDEALHFPWLSWLENNWSGITVRQERRCVRTPLQMSQCIQGIATWAHKDFARVRETLGSENPTINYDILWSSVMDIPYFGRYISTRFIEGLRRHLAVNAEMPNMRNEGGWSPKEALVYLYPEHTVTLLTEGKENNKIADILVDDLIARFAADGFEINYYQLAAILCDYRGAFQHRKEYPGWDVDVEISFYEKVTPHWGEQIIEPFYAARKELLPNEALGEIQGWHGVRPELATTLRDHDYVWSDLVYDYKATKNLARPVARQ